MMSLWGVIAALGGALLVTGVVLGVVLAARWAHFDATEKGWGRSMLLGFSAACVIFLGCVVRGLASSI